MLPGWEGSEGAFAEYALAKKLGKRILMMPELSFFLDKVKLARMKGRLHERPPQTSGTG